MFTQKHIKGQLTAALAGSTMLVAVAAKADQVFLDDLIVEGSICAGLDCNNGESFGFDTIRLKENNLRIHFDDTSTTASFPGNDWRIIANDTSNGGTNHLSIEDSTAGRSPFRVEAGASANALVVEADSDIGIGTLDPVVELHVVDGDSPTLRLEQNGSSGFTPQTYDLVSNEANFFIRDVTNGSQLPFRIKPGADSDSLFIAADNDVGVGTDSPSGPLHVRRTSNVDVLTPHIFSENSNANVAQRHMLSLKNNGVVYASLIDASVAAGANTGQQWNIFNAGGDFQILTAPGGAGESEFVLDVDGNLSISGEITTSGSCSAGCDRVFEEEYPLPSIEDHAKAMWENNYLPAVGPTAETGPMNLSQKIGGMLNELEKAHIYIEQLHKRIEDLEDAVSHKG